MKLPSVSTSANSSPSLDGREEPLLMASSLPNKTFIVTKESCPRDLVDVPSSADVSQLVEEQAHSSLFHVEQQAVPPPSSPGKRGRKAGPYIPGHSAQTGKLSIFREVIPQIYFSALTLILSRLTFCAHSTV